MSYSKRGLLDKAIEITKKYARSGHSGAVDSVLKNVYDRLVELNEDVKKEEK